jgi:hypothetical protein
MVTDPTALMRSGLQFTTLTMRNTMNTMLTTDSRQEPSVQTVQERQPVRRVGLVDRAALHLGVALIKWGRRPESAQRYERRANLLERALLSSERDRYVDAERQKAVLRYGQMLRIR